MIDLREDHTCGMAAHTLLRPDKREARVSVKIQEGENAEEKMKEGRDEIQRRRRVWLARTAG